MCQRQALLALRCRVCADMSAFTAQFRDSMGWAKPEQEVVR